jgi:hypothetical protein
MGYIFVNFILLPVDMNNSHGRAV